jgi:hypothetical protein
MKQNVVMIRKMGNFDVSQRTVDGMFDATALAKQWNKKHNTKKETFDFLKLDNTKEFIDALIEDENSENLIPRNIGFKTHVILKGKYGGTWMTPLLFIKFSMWLNPRFEVQVLKFVYDELIKQRNDAGDNYISLSASGIKLNGYDFREVAIAMQWIVFNKKGKNLRQSATQDELKELNDLQGKLAFLIDNNYITTYNQLLADMRIMYNKKYRKF